MSDRREMTGGRFNVKSLEDRVEPSAWRVRRSDRYSGLEVFMILKVIERILYLIRSVILSQWSDFKTGEIWQNLDFR